MSATQEVLNTAQELAAAIDAIVEAWDGGDLAGAVNNAREAVQEARSLIGGGTVLSPADPISKTTFTFTVLHRTDEPFIWDGQEGVGPYDNNLGEALARSWDGHAVGWVADETTVVPSDQVAAELVALGNDGTFFDDDLGLKG